MSEQNPIKPAASEPLGYLMESGALLKLRQVSARLNEPRSLSFDDRRDLANLIDLLVSQAEPISQESLRKEP